MLLHLVQDLAKWSPLRIGQALVADTDPARKLELTFNMISLVGRLILGG